MIESTKIDFLFEVRGSVYLEDTLKKIQGDVKRNLNQLSKEANTFNKTATELGLQQSYLAVENVHCNQLSKI